MTAIRSYHPAQRCFGAERLCGPAATGAARRRHRSRRRSRVPSRRRRRAEQADHPGQARQAVATHLGQLRAATGGQQPLGSETWVCMCWMTSPIPFIASVPTTAGITAGAGRSVRTGRGKRRISTACRVAWGGSSGSKAKRRPLGCLFCGR